MDRLTVLVIALIIFIAPGHVLPQEQTQQPPQDQPAAEPEAPAQGELIMPGQTPDAQQGAEPRAVEGQTTDENGRYTIRQGDTLWDISNAFLKDPFLWPLIWKVNPYIKNPDLIYPGNKLVIPSLAPIERAMAAPPAEEQERPLQEETVEEHHEPEVAALPARPRPRPVEPKPEEETAPSKPKIILPEEAAAPIIDKYSMINAGFIAQEETDDRIIGSPENKTIFAYDDVVYVEIKSVDNPTIGDRFLIYKPMDNVRHPKTGEKFGRLIKVLGILKIIAKDSPDMLTGRITLSFDASEPGSLLAPYQEPSLVYPKPPAADKSIEPGYILEVVDGRTINAQMDIVYLDKGSADGVEPGDRFMVFIEPENGTPRKALGEIQVFLVKERTSTGIVKKSVDTLAKGDMLEYRK